MKIVQKKSSWSHKINLKPHIKPMDLCQKALIPEWAISKIPNFIPQKTKKEIIKNNKPSRFIKPHLRSHPFKGQES